MAPRVLVVQHALELDNRGFDPVEQVVAPDGDAALARLAGEPFTAVYLDLSLAALDGWFVLATVGSWAERPRLVAVVRTRAERDRALALGADTYLMAAACPVERVAVSA